VSVERCLLFCLAETSELRGLTLDIEAAAARAGKSDPGDRADIVRFEALCGQLEALVAGHPRSLVVEIGPSALTAAPSLAFAHQHAEDALCKGPPGLLACLPPLLASRVAMQVSAGDLTLLLTLALSEGQQPRPGDDRASAEPAAPWRAEDGMTGRRAVEQRFREQLDAVAVRGAPEDRGAAMCPSGIHNRVLAKVLREFVDGDPSRRVDARVVYRDGSEASAPFPLHCLRLAEKLPFEPDLSLDLALLSIRHTEMDPVIDGSWLRNAEVSRPRPAGLTDDFVFRTTVAQLNELTAGGSKRALIRIYQTGLDTAIVGFYRGVVHHLLLHPRSLAVIPQFYVGVGDTPGRAASTMEPAAKFVPGEVWAVEP
jgi:hypothetical protein